MQPDDIPAFLKSSARTPANIGAHVQVPLIDLQPWYSYVLKTEKAQTDESDTTGIPSKQLPSHEPEQKVTSVLLVEVGKEIMGLYTKTKKGAAPVRPLPWVLAYRLAGLHTDVRRRNAMRLLCLGLACFAAQLQAQLLLAAFPAARRFIASKHEGLPLEGPLSLCSWPSPGARGCGCQARCA